jgi:hypothetical protein
VQLNSEGLPLRPGVGNCQHYMKHGWCLFKQDCWFHHPERCVGMQVLEFCGKLVHVDSRTAGQLKYE